MGTLATWKFDQDAISEALAYMIIVDGLPFKFVEGEGFKRLMSQACPRFRIPSRLMVTRDCYQLYLDEKMRLKAYLKNNCQSICLTTNTWTSVQGINYICITAHFIDEDWKLHKKVINFCPVSSHKGEYVGKAIDGCLQEWGIQNVFNITVDNASSNDTAIAFLKKKIVNWGSTLSNCKYLHMRCIAYVINLVVDDGLKDVNPSIKRVRDAIRYIRNSPARLEKFKECIEWGSMQTKRSLCLDVPIRWNSTYLMLRAAEKYEQAFDNYADQESSFVSDLGENGVPTSIDWSCVRKMADLLEHFYELTLSISGSLYVTSNTFFGEIIDLCFILNEWRGSSDLLSKRMGDLMKEKFDKYWGDPDKMNKLIFFAYVLDPREKFEYLEYIFCQMYGDEKGKNLFVVVKTELFELFKEYTNKYQPPSNVTDGKGMSKKRDYILKSRFKKRRAESGVCTNKKTEIEIYLNENIIDDADDLDILKWWKLHSERFPILSRMARDVLAVSISTVASESGRVLDSFRSSLTPKIVEGLICAQDWLRKRPMISIEEDLQELEKFEENLPNVGIAPASWTNK